MRVTLLLSLLLLAAGACWAAPSLNGPTGVLNTPNAAVVPTGTYNAFLNFAKIGEADLTRYGINAGLGTATPFEVGFTSFDVEDEDSHLVLNAKVVLPVQMKSPGALALGVFDLTDEEDAQTPYLVYSREFTTGQGPQARPIYASIGFGSNDWDWILDGLFLSACMPVSDQALVMLEFDAEDFNAGARFQIAENFSADVGIVNDELAFGLAYYLVPK